MANEIGDAKRGLATALVGIEGLRVFDYAPEGVHEFPAAIVRLESRESVETLGGGSVRGSSARGDAGIGGGRAARLRTRCSRS